MRVSEALRIELKSTEQIALELARIIWKNQDTTAAGKEAILDIYAECLLAVRAPEMRLTRGSAVERPIVQAQHG